jgi:hypothetical protein
LFRERFQGFTAWPKGPFYPCSSLVELKGCDFISYADHKPFAPLHVLTLLNVLTFLANATFQFSLEFSRGLVLLKQEGGQTSEIHNRSQ